MTDNFINISNNVLSIDTCNTAIEIIEDCILNGYDDMHTHTLLAERNDTALFANFSETDGPFVSVTKQIKSLLKKEFAEYNARYEITNLPTKAVIYPIFKFQKSAPGQGYTQWHTEQGVLRPDRFAVWMIYLNDVVKGGKTSWLHQECSVQPTQGTLVIWPAAYTHKHRADPDLQENKYIATGWFEYPSN